MPRWSRCASSPGREAGRGVSGKTFVAAIDALFHRLHLGAARYDASGIVRLTVDRTAVALHADGPEQMALTATVGPLPAAPPARAAATREILRAGAGLLLDNGGGFYMRREPGGEDFLAVRGVFPYRAADTVRLVAILEDVVHLAEVGRATLDIAAGASRPSPARSSRTIVEETLIFRP